MLARPESNRESSNRQAFVRGSSTGGALHTRGRLISTANQFRHTLRIPSTRALLRRLLCLLDGRTSAPPADQLVAELETDFALRLRTRDGSIYHVDHEEQSSQNHHPLGVLHRVRRKGHLHRFGAVHSAEATSLGALAATALSPGVLLAQLAGPP